MKINQTLIKSLTLATSIAMSPMAVLMAAQTTPTDAPTNLTVTSAKTNDYIQKKLERMSKHLNLTADQKQAIQGVMMKNQAQMETLYRTMSQQRTQLMDLANSNDYTDSTAQKLAAEHAQTGEKLNVLKAAQRHEIWQKLTPEQQQKLKSMMAKRQRMKSGDGEMDHSHH